MKVTHLEVGNYRGDLQIKKVENNYYWCVGCDLENEEDWEWVAIPRGLYYSILDFHECA